MSDLLRPQPAGIPLPAPNAVSAPFWAGCRQGELRFQRCRDCGGITFLPASACTHCLSPGLAWETGTGLGTIASWTVVWRPQTPAFRTPYAPAIVTLDEGYRMMTSIIGLAPDELRSGLRVTVDFHPASDEITLPYFRPAS